jgi:hypothetical protein
LKSRALVPVKRLLKSGNNNPIPTVSRIATENANKMANGSLNRASALRIFHDDRIILSKIGFTLKV